MNQEQSPDRPPPVDESKVDSKRDKHTPSTDKNRRERKPLSCFEIWTIVLGSIGILVAAGTGAAIFWQAKISAWTLEEIKKGSSDTHDLADAAKIQSGKMSNMSNAADKIGRAAQDMVIQDQRIADNAKASLDATIANARLDQRAWVAEIALQMDSPEVGKIMHGYVAWSNSGKTFAKKVEPSCHFIFVPTAITSEDALKGLVGNGTIERTSIGVLAPNAQYKTPLESKMVPTEDDKAKISGSWYTYVWGEMTYVDIFGHSHSTVFCSSRQGSSGDFVQCPFHNDAD
jgi:hypothetical protein